TQSGLKPRLPVQHFRSHPQECVPAGTVDLIARLKQQAAAGDVIAEITLNSLLSSPLYAPRK
ncbi:MAG: hypothetical protein ABTS16_22520, partial [Candidatus Accumulibacter phosphatis]